MILVSDRTSASQGFSPDARRQRHLVARTSSLFQQSLRTSRSVLFLWKRWLGSCQSWQANGAAIWTSLPPVRAPSLFVFRLRFRRILRRLWNKLCKNGPNGSSGAKSTDQYSKSIIEKLE